MAFLQLRMMSETDLPDFTNEIYGFSDRVCLEHLLEEFRKPNSGGAVIVGRGKRQYCRRKADVKIGFVMYRIRAGYATVSNFAVDVRHHVCKEAALMLLKHVKALISDDPDCCIKTIRAVIPETDVWRLCRFRERGFFGTLRKGHFGDVDGVLMRYPVPENMRQFKQYVDAAFIDDSKKEATDPWNNSE